jgi:serine/threonine protein kinase
MSNFDPKAAWPGWETVRLIGRGSFGAVYEIRREVFGDTERCALKHISIPQDESEIQEMRIEGQDGESITRSFTDRAKSIVSEYKLMMQLVSCPNVVTCHDVETVQKDSGYGWDIYIRMELLTPLMKRLEEQPNLPEGEILRLGREIANALEACRRRNIIHRDIKPQNIMVAADGTYKLGDFGIARVSEKTGSATSRIGTYTYMAPEVYNGEHYGAPADLYSLGMVLYWLLNRRRAPFVTVNTAEEKSAALRRRMRGEAIPAPLNGSPALKRIVLKCCAFDPQERYQTAAELLRALDAVGAIHESPADPGERRFAPVGVGVLDDPQTATNTNGLSRAPAPTAETSLSEEDETEGLFGAAAVGTIIRRPPVTSNAETRDNTVGAGLAPARERGERRFAPVGVGVLDDPKTAANTNGLSRGPAFTAETSLSEEDETEGLFGAAAVGAAISRLPVTSNAETRDNTIGAGLAPARERGERRFAPVGVGVLDDPQTATNTNGLSRAPAPTAENEDKTVSNLERRKAAPEDGAAKPKKNKKRSILLIRVALAVLMTLSLIILLSPQRSKSKTAREASVETPTPTPEPTPEPIDETALAYENTLALLEAGQYEEAIAAFEALGDYEDSAERLLQARYGHADALATEGKTYEAALAFSEIRDYRDAWDRCFALWGQITQRETISAGGLHTVGLRSDGTVVAVGDNYYGQLNVGDWAGIMAVCASGSSENCTVGLRMDGIVLAVGYNDHGQCEVSDWTDIVAISSGVMQTVGLRANGTVLATGNNFYGQCDVGGWSNIVAVSAGGLHTVGLRSDGTVVAVGRNDDGQCDVSDWTDIVAVSAGYLHTVGLRSDGTVVAVGSNGSGQCEVSGWTDIVAVSAGDYHTVGLRSDGTVVAVGSNDYGQCDVSGWTDIVAVSAGLYHTVGLRSDGTVVAVGSNGSGLRVVSGWTDIALPEKRARN